MLWQVPHKVLVVCCWLDSEVLLVNALALIIKLKRYPRYRGSRNSIYIHSIQLFTSNILNTTHNTTAHNTPPHTHTPLLLQICSISSCSAYLLFPYFSWRLFIGNSLVMFFFILLFLLCTGFFLLCCGRFGRVLTKNKLVLIDQQVSLVIAIRCASSCAF